METLTRIAEPVVASMGLEIWGVEILQGGRPVVRLYVDAPRGAPAAATENGTDAGVAPEGVVSEAVSPEAVSIEAVSIDQCTRISRMVGLALEVEDVFASAYVLEVSSPGLSRLFFRVEQMIPYMNDMVELVLAVPQPQWPGRKKFRGRLLAVEGDVITLAVESGAEHTGTEEEHRLQVRWEDVRKAARLHVFPEPQKPGKKKNVAKN